MFHNEGAMYEFTYKNEVKAHGYYETAFYWYNQAARQGHSMSMANIAKMYATGEYVQKDMDTALYWLNKSGK